MEPLRNSYNLYCCEKNHMNLKAGSTLMECFSMLLLAAEFFPFVRCEYACCLSCLPEVCSWPVPQHHALECRLVGFTTQSNHKNACQPVNVVGFNKMYTECSVGTTRALKLSILFSCTILSFPYLPQCSVHPCCSSAHSSILSQLPSALMISVNYHSN